MNEFSITFAAILSWTVLSVASRILLVNFGFDPWIFSFLQTVAGGITLLALGYRGARSGRSFTRLSTWGLGALRVISASLYTAALALVSVLEAGTIGAINLPVVALLIFIVNRSAPRGIAWLGNLIVIIAVAFMAMRLASDVRVTVLTLMGVNAMCLGAMNIIAEQHPENRSATLAGRAWFSGVVLAITASFFLLLRMLQGGEIASTFNGPLIVASVAVGILLRAPSMFLTFWAINVAGAQGYTAAIAFLPLLGMGLEQAAVALNLLDASRFQFDFLYIALLALAGTLMVWGSQRQRD